MADGMEMARDHGAREILRHVPKTYTQTALPPCCCRMHDMGEGIKRDKSSVSASESAVFTRLESATGLIS